MLINNNDIYLVLASGILCPNKMTKILKNGETLTNPFYGIQKKIKMSIVGPDNKIYFLKKDGTLWLLKHYWLL